eukprot:TRINITY_DN1190_c0_g1_i2.p1 TRINITY_DN1190_c0_g1~~TRINITY_DN1190_c0_g1_i2.p1  ORF type:complete len:448 (+),score=86.26 TRINITY_DN1190_c0_g1_i2:29-1345(+)
MQASKLITQLQSNFLPGFPAGKVNGAGSTPATARDRAVVTRERKQASSRPVICVASTSSQNGSSPKTDPLLVLAARGESVPRPPAWMMRQAGRYMAVYRKLAEKYTSFRVRSETPDLIVEISLQPWRAFKPDGVIIFSDILTPLPAMGLDFEIDEARGPLMGKVIQQDEDVQALHALDLERLSFVSESLTRLRSEVAGEAAILGFVGSPWTLATYCVEGKSTRTYTIIKSMAVNAPGVLHALLEFLSEQIATYAIFQVDAGADCVQLFDSWGGQLPPHLWDVWSRPYLEKIINRVHKERPGVPVVLYVNGSGGLIERMGATGADVIGLDWTIDMADARTRLVGSRSTAVQGNVDPAILFASKEAVIDAVHLCVQKAGPKGHVLNLGHGVLVGTPEESVEAFFETARSLSYAAFPPFISSPSSSSPLVDGQASLISSRT